jgi:tripartite-type tricarboxylate transporter receptor subunit TctC
MVTRRAFLMSTAALATLPALSARADAWPTRPIRLIVPFPPGGLTDGIARITAQRLEERLGQPFVPENEPGASGAIAAATVARAPADGYTLFVGSLTQIAVIPALRPVSYDPVKDFAPISNIASAPFVLMINADMPTRTVAEFVAYVRQRPGQLSYGSAGPGSTVHLTMALFLERAGLSMVHVPYKGGAQVLPDLMAGRIAAYFGTRTDAMQQGQSEKVRLLAVSDDSRSPQFPEVPTVAESGYPGFRTRTWNGLMAPAGTPQPIIDRLAEEVRRAVADPAFIDKLAKIGVDPVGGDPKSFAATIAADMPLWANAVRVAGLKS